MTYLLAQERTRDQTKTGKMIVQENDGDMIVSDENLKSEVSFSFHHNMQIKDHR